eukprot:12640021-Alexandrium_andersonii.AAC.1
MPSCLGRACGAQGACRARAVVYATVETARSFGLDMAPRALSDAALVDVSEDLAPVAVNGRALAAGDELALFDAEKPSAATSQKKGR